MAYRSLSSSLPMPSSPLKATESGLSSEDLTKTRELSRVILSLSSPRLCWFSCPTCLTELIMDWKYSPDFNPSSEKLTDGNDGGSGNSPASEGSDGARLRCWRLTVIERLDQVRLADPSTNTGPGRSQDQSAGPSAGQETQASQAAHHSHPPQHVLLGQQLLVGLWHQDVDCH